MDNGSEDERNEPLSHLPEVFKPELNKEDLLRNFQAILANDLNSEDIKQAWVNHFELVIEPCGWLAVWYPSTESAAKFDCTPGRDGACVVEVLDVQLSDLNAEIELLQFPESMVEPGCEDSTEPIHCSVPVIEVFPVLHQENEHLNIDRWAEALSLYRFFYQQIWRPWDFGSNTEDWPETHLKNRLDLAFDLATKTGNYGIAIKLERLASDGNATRSQLTALVKTIADNNSYAEDDDNVGTIMELHQRNMSIKLEAMALEDPVNRQAFLNNTMNERRRKRKRKEPGIILVWKDGTVQEMSILVGDIAADNPDAPLHIVPNLEHALDIAVPNDMVHMARFGTEMVSSLGELTHGGKLIGPKLHLGQENFPSSADSCVIRQLIVGDIFLVVEGDVELKNLVIELPPSLSIGILVAKGSLLMENVTIKSGKIGVKMLSGTEATLSDCKFHGCEKGIVHSTTSKLNIIRIEMIDCLIDKEEENSDEKGLDDEIFVEMGRNLSNIQIHPDLENQNSRFLASKWFRRLSSTPKFQSPGKDSPVKRMYGGPASQDSGSDMMFNPDDPAGKYVSECENSFSSAE